MALAIAPSFMSANLLHVEDEIRALEPIADFFHVDIIDWHYVKNMCLTPQFIRAMHSATTVPIDAHLYVDNVDDELVQLCLDSGAGIITMPADVIGRSVHRFAYRIHSAGALVGIFLNPSQPVETVLPYAEVIDHLLLMSVDPGFGGQDFIPATYDRIRTACNLRKNLGLNYRIVIDGNCNADRFHSLAEAGADALCLGRGLFDCDPDTRRAGELTAQAINAINAELNRR